MTVPSIEMHCANSNEGGGYQAGSTVTFGDAVPPGTFQEGVVNLLLPGDSRTGATATPCEGDPYIETVSHSVVSDAADPGRGTVDREMIAELNGTATQ